MVRNAEGRLVRDEMVHPIDDGHLDGCPLRVEFTAKLALARSEQITVCRRSQSGDGCST
jgi:hypothetical protein